MNCYGTAIEADATNFGEYAVEVTKDAEGKATGIKLTANSEDVPSVKITSTEVTDMQATATLTTTPCEAAEDPVSTFANGGWNNLIGGGVANVPDLQKGDKLKFAFTVSGKSMTVTLEAGKNFQIYSR